MWHSENSLPRRNQFVRVTSLVTALFFLINNTPVYSAAINPILSRSASEKDIYPSQLTLPTGLGKIQETYQSPSKGRTVVLIQDAHAIPDAQRSIHGIIDYFIFMAA